jgi:hypothetical protein
MRLNHRYKIQFFKYALVVNFHFAPAALLLLLPPLLMQEIIQYINGRKREATDTNIQLLNVPFCKRSEA